MAPSQISTVFFLLVTTAALTAAIPQPEYNSLLHALRSRNCHLFADAISTTDIESEILSAQNLTLFVPNDRNMYSAMLVSDYIELVRYHIVPNHRFKYSDLRQLGFGFSPFPTLLRGEEIQMINNPENWNILFLADGVNVNLPDSYVDKNVVVHGLENTFDLPIDIDMLDTRCGIVINEEEGDLDYFRGMPPPPPPFGVALAETAAEARSEVNRSELITHQSRGSESATQSVERRVLIELDIKEIHDVSVAARSETRGDDAEEVNLDLDELGTGTSELISENPGHVSLVATCSVEEFSLMGDNKMIDCATDGGQYCPAN